LVEETGENHQPVASYWQTLSHNAVSSTPRLSGIRTHNNSSDSREITEILLKVTLNTINQPNIYTTSSYHVHTINYQHDSDLL
jgi:hypothetical protein